MVPDGSLAETTADTWTDTLCVVAVKLSLVAPETTVTKGGTITDIELLLNEIGKPPNGAGPFNITVPEVEVPPVRVDGLSDMLRIVGGTTVSVTPIEPEPRDAVIFGDD